MPLLFHIQCSSNTTPNYLSLQFPTAHHQPRADINSQDGKPYILYVCAGEAHDDPRSNGYTVVAKTEFASMEDMKYYDDECPAHAELKKTVTTLNVSEKPMSVYFTSSATVLE